MQPDLIQQRRMQKMRNAADLLDGVVHEFASIGCQVTAWRRLRRASCRHSFEHHFGGDQILAQPIVQFARDAPALFVLRRDQAGSKGGATRGSAFPAAGVLRCSSAKTLTLARSTSGTTGTEM